MKQNFSKKNKTNKYSQAATRERLSQFQRKFPYKFRQVFDYYRDGQKELREGAVQEAKASFEKALSIYQEYIPAQNQLAMIYGMLHHYKEALQFARIVVKLDDKNVLAFLQGAIFLYKLGQEKEAESFAKSALIAFHEREGQDPYNDYDMLQRLVEMLSVLRDDKILSNLYKVRKSQLSPMSFYRAALALSNQGFIEDAISALQSIKEGSDYTEQGEFLENGIKIFVNENLPIPKLYEEGTGVKQVMVVSSLFIHEDQKKQDGLEYLKKSDSNWSVEVTKALLKSNALEVKLKKSLLSFLADSSESKQMVDVCFQKEMYEIPLNKLEKFDEIISTFSSTFQTSDKVSAKDNKVQASILKKQAISRKLNNFTKDKLILIVKACKISGYSKLNKKGLTELIGKEIVEKAPSSLEIKDLDEIQKIIDLMLDQIER